MRLAYSKLRDEGIVASCEQDENAAIGMLLVHLLFQRPCFSRSFAQHGEQHPDPAARHFPAESWKVSTSRIAPRTFCGTITPAPESRRRCCGRSASRSRF